MTARDRMDVDPPSDYPLYKSTALRAPKQPLLRVAPHPIETAGPVFPKSFAKESAADLTGHGRLPSRGRDYATAGERYCSRPQPGRPPVM